MNKKNNGFSPILKSIGDLIELQNQTINQNLPIYKSEITEIINNKITDNNRIEHLLDSLLDISFNEQVLKLFKKNMSLLLFYKSKKCNLICRSISRNVG